ncbi:hypothetical protein H6G33_37530 [Calothrix sp. FACHB-1219]|uniref:hypothetical protein n=1 Tax=unclassified Calothrix TaxID=2619626 RepID=UPI001689EE95|nr:MULTISPECIES: hypothetical protein [unclassified Calothrix]MBD2208093.1 hypothetical protein [Calothrix sp. FACHB-168]MBD2222631.1 hypothetical protein [Calothrix sp. FACHB-1219]
MRTVTSIFLIITLISCSVNSTDSKNSISDSKNSISGNNVKENSNSPVSTSSTTSSNKDEEYINKVRKTIINSYKNAELEKPLLKIDIEKHLSFTHDDDLINAGKLACKILENIDPKEDKFNPNTMIGAAKNMKHPVVYTKVKEYLDTKIKFDKNDLDYISLNDLQKIVFLNVVPYLISHSVYENSTAYYCQDKN